MSGVNFNDTDKLAGAQAEGGVQKVVSATLGSSFSVTSMFSTYQDVTGLSVTFTTNFTNQVILLCLTASALVGSGADVAFLAYTLDGGSDVKVISAPFSSAYGNLSFALPITIASPGSHTIQLRAAKSTTTYNIVVDAANAPILSAII